MGPARWVGPGHLRATLYREWDENRINTQATWYYFRLEGVRGLPLTLELTGLADRYEGRPSHSIAERDKPCVSSDGVRWERLLSAQFDRERAVLTLRLTPETDTLWVAHLEPYTGEHLDRLAADHAGSPYLRRESAGRSVAGRDIPLWTVTDPEAPEGGKRVVWLMARQHAWETHTSYCLDGLVRFLLGETPEAAELRRRLLVRLLPMMDPDGVARGGTRLNRHGYDLNRHWDRVDPDDPGACASMPEIAAAKHALRDWLASGRPVDLFLSFHDTQDDVLILAPPLVEHPCLLRLLEEMRRIGFAGGVQNAGSINASTVETALHAEFGILTGLVELGTADLPTYGRPPTAEDRVRFGADLAMVLGGLRPGRSRPAAGRTLEARWEGTAMADKIGVAMLSFAHVHAPGYADQVQNNPDAELVAVWDDDPARGRAEAAKRGLPFYADLQELLALPGVQGVVCDAPTNLHPAVLIAAAEAGKHIFTEKALTIGTKDATEVVAAVRKAGVKFMISLPSRTRPETLFAKQVIDQGLLGDITEMRARIAHMAALDRWFQPGPDHSGSTWFGDEEAAGGGAFFDLGCHRVDVMRWFLGEPKSVVARMNNFAGAYPIDDNMVAVVEFKNKALGILDVSWVHRCGPNPLEIYGTHGYLAIEAGPGPKVWLESTKLDAGGIQGAIAPTNLPAALPTPMVQWINAIKDGTPMTIDITDGWNLTQLLEGCYTAARTGRAFEF